VTNRRILVVSAADDLDAVSIVDGSVVVVVVVAGVVVVVVVVVIGWHVSPGISP